MDKGECDEERENFVENGEKVVSLLEKHKDTNAEFDETVEFRSDTFMNLVVWKKREDGYEPGLEQDCTPPVRLPYASMDAVRQEDKVLGGLGKLGLDKLRDELARVQEHSRQAEQLDGGEPRIRKGSHSESWSTGKGSHSESILKAMGFILCNLLGQSIRTSM